jgi:hypothetical protein
MKKQIEECFIYSWVVNFILGILLTALSLFITVWSLEHLTSLNGEGLKIFVVICFWFLLFSFGFMGCLLFSIGTLMGEGCTNQMVLCRWGLWPKPKKLRSRMFGSSPFDWY